MISGKIFLKLIRKHSYKIKDLQLQERIETSERNKWIYLKYTINKTTKLAKFFSKREI